MLCEMGWPEAVVKICGFATIAIVAIVAAIVGIRNMK